MRRIQLLATSLTVGLAVLLSLQPVAVAWEPTRPVEFIVMAGKGGGADKAVRLMQSIIAKHKMAPVPFTPINKPGGTGAEALVYLKQKKGDDHVIMFTLNSFYTTPLRQPKLGVDIKTYTPIARMAEDTFLLWVNSERKDINNIEEFVKAAKAKGKDWIMAGTGKNSEDNLLTDFLNSAYGLDMKYVPFKGGGRVAKELVERNADSTVNNPSEQLDYYEAGTTKPLAAFTPERLAVFRRVPTLREMGMNFFYYMQRTVVGAPGMSKEAVAYYTTLFKRVFETPEWQTYRRKKSLHGAFLTGPPLKDYWLREREKHYRWMVAMDAMKGVPTPLILGHGRADAASGR